MMSHSRILFPLLVLSVLSTFLFSSCQKLTCGSDKSSFLKEYKNFVNTLDNDAFELPKAQLKKIDRQHKHFIDDCYPHFEEELTNREKGQFWVNNFMYHRKRHNVKLRNLADLGRLPTEELKKAWDVESEEIEEEITKTVEELKDVWAENKADLEGLVEEAREDIERWLDKLEKILDEE